MVALETPALELNWPAPDFNLPGTDGTTHNLASCLGDKGLVVMFICNHCPFVKSIIDKLVKDLTELQNYGVNSVAIMSNDATAYPEDSFDNMKAFADTHGFTFPYLYDESQATAKSYDAVCTPDFFGFDANLKLRYRGRFDASRMNHTQESNRELFNAMKHLAETDKTLENQVPSIGCSIKWRG